MNINGEESALVPKVDLAPKTEGEHPIHYQIWPDAPTSPPDFATRNRLAEFFQSEIIPPEIKALGVLSAEMLVTSTRQLEHASFTESLYYQTPYGGQPTLYAMSLMEDRIELAVSPIPEYGSFPSIVSVPIVRLQQMTGGVAAEVARIKPEIIKTLLNPNSTVENLQTAKLELIRFLAEFKAGSVQKISDMGGFIRATGVAFTANGRDMVFKLYVNEIPEDDPVLGSAIRFYKTEQSYYKMIRSIDISNMGEMTVDLIEKKLKSLPEGYKKILLGRHGDAGTVAWRILSFARKLGYKPNEAQKAWEKQSRFSSALLQFEGDLRNEMLETITSGTKEEGPGLTNETIDEMFRADYNMINKFGNRRIADDFSITSVIAGQQTIQDLDI